MVLEIPVLVRTDLVIPENHPKLEHIDTLEFLSRIRATINYPVQGEPGIMTAPMVLRPHVTNKHKGKTRVVFRLEAHHLDGLVNAEAVSVGQFVKGEYEQWDQYPLDDLVSHFAVVVPE